MVDDDLDGMRQTLEILVHRAQAHGLGTLEYLLKMAAMELSNHQDVRGSDGKEAASRVRGKKG